MIAESAMIPIPSEIIMPFSGFLVSSSTNGYTNVRFDFLGVVLAGTLGNVLGSVITYIIGIRIGREIIIKYGKYIFFKRKHLEITERWFQKYGNRTSFVGRLLPGIRTYVSLPAGIGKANFKNFVIYSFLGSLIWNVLLTYIGVHLGNNWHNISKYSIYLDIIALIMLCIFIIWFVKNTIKKTVS
jgi:membrane protein DedA with SNARE-associated domain